MRTLFLIFALTFSGASMAERKDGVKPKDQRDIASWESDPEMEIKTMSSFFGGRFTRVIDKKTGLVCYVYDSKGSAVSCYPYK